MCGLSTSFLEMGYLISIYELISQSLVFDKRRHQVQMAFYIDEMSVPTVGPNIAGGPHVLLFFINAFPLEQM